MSLSKLAPECEVCPYKDTCKNKRMVAVGFLKPSSEKLLMPMAETLIVPHDYRNVKIAENTEITIDLEDFKKELEKSIAKQAGLYGCFFNGS